MEQADFLWLHRILDERFLFLQIVSSYKFFMSSYIMPVSSEDMTFSLESTVHIHE